MLVLTHGIDSARILSAVIAVINAMDNVDKQLLLCVSFLNFSGFILYFTHEIQLWVWLRCCFSSFLVFIRLSFLQHQVFWLPPGLTLTPFTLFILHAFSASHCRPFLKHDIAWLASTRNCIQCQQTGPGGHLCPYLWQHHIQIEAPVAPMNSLPIPIFGAQIFQPFSKMVHKRHFPAVSQK